MDSKIKTQEQISAMADGEIPVEQLDGLLASLRDKNAQEDWKLYHQIGDLLRSEDMNVRLSDDFSSRMSAMLDAEPTIVAPSSITGALKPSHDVKAQDVSRPARGSARRWAVPGMAAAAAMAAVAFVATPQLMVAFKSAPEGAPASVASVSVAGNAPIEIAGGSTPQEAVMATSESGEVVVRDPRIDDYLFAHQRYSPSVYSTAQYARSATFATESNK
ncbi:sigma-E factor negative regulatory protein [Noviherbaspirillum sp. CPCC 100848]|uniref:Sigma-E factor negative regulatory protein n=1 Tax=Noviherbaspirillum album TaxID=3080276 RepID=A0ABU6JEN2_9BURK|nr:sigma-E factor negative regulatory protein [Noviherbaspirillum sp. CPCC 100848]MEC4721995.1 sigma-E factor negative regulatory protein [Noviherbaspirillum sp. CPCC 100848]